jgi:outer membrane protein assembly factor BamA
MTRFAPVPVGLLVCLSGWMTAQAQTQPTSKVIEAIEFRRLHRLPQWTIRAKIESQVGDVYSEEALRRDLKTLWKTRYFTDIQVKTEPGAQGGAIIRFEMTERQRQPAANLIEGIEFGGLSGVTQDAMKTTISSKVGDICDELALRRDLNALWNTNRFDDVQVKTEAGPHGGTILRFVVIERQ